MLIYNRGEKPHGSRRDFGHDKKKKKAARHWVSWAHSAGVRGRKGNNAEIVSSRVRIRKGGASTSSWPRLTLPHARNLVDMLNPAQDSEPLIPVALFNNVSPGGVSLWVYLGGSASTSCLGGFPTGVMELRMKLSLLVLSPGFVCPRPHPRLAHFFSLTAHLRRKRSREASKILGLCSDRHDGIRVFKGLEHVVQYAWTLMFCDGREAVNPLSMALLSLCPPRLWRCGSLHPDRFLRTVGEPDVSLRGNISFSRGDP